MSKSTVGLLDIVTDTLNAFNNIYFIASFIVCLWLVIASVCTKSIYYRKNIIINLKALRDTTVKGHLGGMLR